MVVVVTQPVWSIQVCEEIYQFKLPRRISDVLLRIEAFYRWRKLRDVVRTETTLRFARGWSHALNFSCDERNIEQEVNIDVSADICPVVACHYLCRVGLFALAVSPRRLQIEVEELERFLLDNVAGNGR